MPSKLPRVRTALLAGLAALSLGGVAAAATGLSPVAAERATQAPPGSSAGKAAASAHGAAATFVPGPDARDGAAANGSAATSGDHATGPDASGAARHGLCQAWAAGQGDDHGRWSDAPAFQALADAAGGADQIAAYCAEETATSATHGKRPATPPGSDDHGKASPPTTGPPASPGNGNGQGQGGPPTTA